MLLNEDQLAIRDLARRFTRERLAPYYQARETAGVMDRQLVREMGSLGLLGADLPEKFDGLGVPGVTAGVIAEELAYGDFNISAVPVSVSLLGAIVMGSATPAIAEHWVPRMVSGEALLGICVTEPSGGSDAANLKLRCRRDGAFYILNGEKTSITFADSADAFIVFARTGSPDSGAAGITAMIVPADTPGIARTRFDDVGSRIIGRGSVFFEDVRVPIENRLGTENQGFTHVMRGFDYSRALIALQCVGCAQASLDEAWEYTKTRTAFGAPIAQYQGVTFPLVEGESLLAAVRQLSYHALALRDAGQPHTAEAAMVKWLGPKTAFDVIHQCLLTFGHYGWSKDLPHQQRMRDVMGLEIGDGTAGIMKLIVARERVGRAAVQYSKR
ncbi:cyclohexanecarboxyl-CoA dehydrogenase [Nitrobacteraceae bacterium AZCC 2161]